MNNLISDDHVNNNHPVRTAIDEGQDTAGKNLFCKLYCPQAYRCLEMADQRSVEMLAVNPTTKTFAYRRLAQGFSRSLSAFSSFLLEYLQPILKVDQGAQYVNDKVVVSNSPEQLITKFRGSFQCVQKTA